MFPPHKQTCFILLPGFSPDRIPVIALKKALENHGYTAITNSFFGDTHIENFQILTIQKCQMIGIRVSLRGAILIEQAINFFNLPKMNSL